MAVVTRRCPIMKTITFMTSFAVSVWSAGLSTPARQNAPASGERKRPQTSVCSNRSQKCSSEYRFNANWSNKRHTVPSWALTCTMSCSYVCTCWLYYSQEWRLEQITVGVVAWQPVQRHTKLTTWERQARWRQRRSVARTTRTVNKLSCLWFVSVRAYLPRRRQVLWT